MKREIKNKGVYVEVDSVDIIDRLKEIDESEVFTIRQIRTEFAGDEARRFVKLLKTKHIVLLNENEHYKSMDSHQKSDYLIRSIMLGD